MGKNSTMNQAQTDAEFVRDLIVDTMNLKEGSIKRTKFARCMFVIEVNKPVQIQLRVENSSTKVYETVTRKFAPGKPWVVDYVLFEQLIHREFRENGGHYKKKLVPDGEKPLVVTPLDVQGLDLKPEPQGEGLPDPAMPSA